MGEKRWYGVALTRSNNWQGITNGFWKLFHKKKGFERTEIFDSEAFKSSWDWKWKSTHSHATLIAGNTSKQRRNQNNN